MNNVLNDKNFENEFNDLGAGFEPEIQNEVNKENKKNKKDRWQIKDKEINKKLADIAVSLENEEDEIEKIELQIEEQELLKEKENNKHNKKINLINNKINRLKKKKNESKEKELFEAIEDSGLSHEQIMDILKNNMKERI